MQSRFLGQRSDFVLLMAASLLVASCSSTTNGAARPGQSSGDPPTSSDQREISEPLDISAYLSKPCYLVSSEKLAELGFSREGGEPHLPEDDEFAAQTGPDCGWIGDGDGSISVIIASKNAERGLGGLEGLRSLHEQGRFDLWEEISVAGYPAAHYGVTDARSKGDCNVAVGIADDMAVSVTAISFRDNPVMACDVAKGVAVDVIRTLEGGR
ncbi:DUF3558 domain-containing protein [Saccharomonospora azurea]|uniref:DUF3558 domain-containing protein n=1 Tax=Saccharomonospora azurea TaxID=40988 RepID=UPI003D90C872